MKQIKVPRIMVVGTGSGCGKTTVTCALLNHFKKSLNNVVAFKSGPDYIDPMFHTEVLGVDSSNLDMFLLDNDTIKHLFYSNSYNKNLAILEGAMGIYDGKGFSDDTCSCNHLSKLLNIKEILVVNVRGKSVSLLAEIYGYLTFKENNIKGIILNYCSKGMYSTYKEMIETNFNVKVLGFIPKDEGIVVKSRHLGLITAGEINDLKEKLYILEKVTKDTIDYNAIYNLAKESESISFKEIDIENICINKPKIAVAKDKAFCFYYNDSLNLLRKLGSTIEYFSPMNDKSLPKGISGIILGGGYPEEYIKELSENKSMLLSLKKAYNDNVPIFAECGGFMYLGNTIKVKDISYKVCGVLDSDFYMTDKLVRFGYSKLSSNNNNMLLNSGETVACHEFHYSDGTNCGNSLTSNKSEKRKFLCGECKDNIFALYPHIHFYSNIEIAKRFVKKCDDYKSNI